MANGKAAGPSGVTPDALKAMVWREEGLKDGEDEDEVDNDDADHLASVIHSLLLDFWESKLDFESWKRGILAPVPKTGDLSNPNKWRPVCLLETTYKVLASIIANRINPVIRDHGLEEQCDSLNSKGCPDANFSLRSALQIRREHDIPTHVLFVDLVKAFDSVNHEFLWLVLSKYGIPRKVIHVIKRMYQDFSLLFTVGNVTEEILYSIGVHQGDNLALLLFNIFFRQPLIPLLKYGAPLVLVNLRSVGFQPRGPVPPEVDCYVSSAQVGTLFHLKNRCM